MRCLVPANDAARSCELAVCMVDDGDGGEASTAESSGPAVVVVCGAAGAAAAAVVVVVFVAAVVVFVAAAAAAVDADGTAFAAAEGADTAYEVESSDALSFSSLLLDRRPTLASDAMDDEDSRAGMSGTGRVITALALPSVRSGTACTALLRCC